MYSEMVALMQMLTMGRTEKKMFVFIHWTFLHALSFKLTVIFFKLYDRLTNDKTIYLYQVYT